MRQSRSASSFDEALGLEGFESRLHILVASTLGKLQDYSHLAKPLRCYLLNRGEQNRANALKKAFHKEQWRTVVWKPNAPKS
jgi:hypothetical protein